MDETIYEILKFALEVWFSIVKLAKKKMDTLRKFSTCTQRKSVFSFVNLCNYTQDIVVPGLLSNLGAVRIFN